MRLVVGHGSGSFGHVAADDVGYDPADGYLSPEAFADVGTAAGELNTIVRRALVDAGVPAVSLPLSALGYVRDGDMVEFDVAPFERLLAWGAVPLTYGDVVLTQTGGTIVSTETLFRHLARRLEPGRIILLGEVEGVYAAGPTAPSDGAESVVLREITPRTWPLVRSGVAGARGTDVTGGMVDKVGQMLTLLEDVPDLEVLIASGLEHGLLHRALSHRQVAGTRVHRWPK